MRVTAGVPCGLAALLQLAGCDADTAEPSSDLARLRHEVEQLARPYIVGESDVGLHVRPSVFASLSSALSGLPAEQRRITFDGTSRSGHVWSAGGGLLGCGGYAEINDEGRNFHFVVDITSLTTTWQQEGTLLARASLSFSGSGNVHGHAHGPAGPCSVLRPLPTCDCPIGGGVGSNAGFNVRKDAVFEGRVRFTSVEGQLGYSLALTTPREVSATLKVGLERIGDLGIPLTLDVPTSPVLSGTLASVFTNRGLVKLPRADLPFTFSVRDVRLTADASGLGLTGRADLQVASTSTVR